tara:strand:+ start:3109 stop:3696 length:588 start_codon:yes stop_codon:yes gene_type:complete
MKHLTNIPLCANTLFIFKLDIKKNLTSEFKKEKFETTKEAPGFISCNLNVLKKYKTLDKEINKAIKLVLGEILQYKNTQYRMCNSWVTKTEPNGYGHDHVHSNSWLSGVYYPEDNKHSGIRFNYDNTIFNNIPKQYNIYNSHTWTLGVEKNLLIIFFSNLKHRILPNLSKQNRYSLAFNILPKGDFGWSDSRIKF